VKEQIWGGDYIDFATLVKSSPTANNSYSVSLVSGNDTAQSLQLVPARPPAITSITQWYEAYEIYMSIYLSAPRNMHLAAQLIKYGRNMKDLARKGGNWAYYDSNFRSLRGAHGWNWGTLNVELWVMALALQTQDKETSEKGKNAPAGTTKGKKGTGNNSFRARSNRAVCYKYNDGTYCKGCNFAHQCRWCAKDHPGIKCNQKSNSGSQQSSNTPAAQGSSSRTSTKQQQ